MGEPRALRDGSTTVIDPALQQPTSTRTPGPSVSVAISEQALAAVEATRMRGLMAGIAGSAALTAAIVMFIGGDPQAVRIHAAALTASAVISGFCAFLFRNPRRYHRQLAVYVILAQVLVLMTGYYFWGIFSAYLALVPLSIYITVGSATKSELVLGVATVTVVPAAFQLATVFDYIESRGLVDTVPGRVDLTTEIVAILLLQVITIGAAVAGRAARRDTAAVIEAHNEALLELARREAQLAEAYADARAAREAGQGGIGRFTDQTIGDFKLGEVIGRGAMGEVYAAHRVGDTTPLAVKILAPHLLRDPTARERFERETAIVSALTSKHVVRVIAVSPPNALYPYIVMERLEGTDLAQMLKRQALRPLDEVREVIKQVASGLDAAHAAGIIHRDLKPSNLFATGDANSRLWKLLDFGAAKWNDGEGTLTGGAIVGTPGYMAPEQAQGRTLDRRADVYALGVIMYRMLTGVPAVVPGEVPLMLQEVAYRMPLQPSKRATVAPQLEAVLAVALAKSPDKRFSTAGELAAAFEAAVAGRLDRDVLKRAEAILHEHPWGEWKKR